MAIGTITVTNDERKQASAPLSLAELSFVGDDSYPTGGTAAFQASVRTALAKDATVIGVIPLGLNGGLDVIYDKANDKLITKTGGTETSNGTDQHTITLKLGVLYM